MSRSDSRTVPQLTIVVGAEDPSQQTFAELLVAALAGRLRARAITPAVAIGRDLVEASRLLLLDWRSPAEMPHLRELLLRGRSRTLVLVTAADLAAGPQLILALRRYAGRVLALDATTAGRLHAALLAPVDCIASDPLAGIAEALQHPPGSADDVDSHLEQAKEWLRRGDDEGAFLAASRALKLHPDQPGIVADVARLLVRLGRPDQAEACCQSYLRQLPDSVPVQDALREVRALQQA